MKLLRFAPMAVIAAMLTVPGISSAGIFLSINIAPPALPVYAQPPCPVDGYLWVPGYWAYGDEGYFWVPGYWAAPPRPGLLWTPGYWGYEGAVYRFHEGYWGPHVGFYGGVNYGFGYTGSGFFGGFWDGPRFRYNTAVTQVNTTVIHNVYNKTVVNNVTVNRTSFNGPGGVNVRPNAQEAVFAREEHINRTSLQATHERNASVNRAQFASVNHGQPARAAVERPGGGFGGPQNRPEARQDRFAGRPPGAVAPNVQANHAAEQPNQQNRMVQQQQNQQNRLAQQEQNRAARQDQVQQNRESRMAQQQQNRAANVEQRQQQNAERRQEAPQQHAAEHRESPRPAAREPEHKEGEHHPH